MQILSNTPMPALPGYEIRHFGQCGCDPAGYKPVSERRSLRTILSQLPTGFRPDLLLFRSPEYLPVPEDLDVFDGPRVLLITDWNVCLRFLPALCRLFDLCFTDAPGTRLLRQAGAANVHHAPLFGHDPRQFHGLDLERDLDLSFCGNLNAGLHAMRNRLVFRLTQWSRGRPVHLRQAFGVDYLRVLNRSRLVFNFSVRGEANMRLYEAMACGAAVLVEKDNEEAPLLFRPGEHYLTYDPDQLENDCENWLRDPEQLLRIGRAAQAAVAEHTQVRQLARMLARTRDLFHAPRFGDAGVFGDPEARRALAKLRMLGAGYSVSQGLGEIERLSSELPELASEALPGLLFLILDSDPGSPLRPGALMRLAAQLENPALPASVRTWFRIGLARAQRQWNEVLRLARECLTQLKAAATAEIDPNYGVLFAPIGLGHGINTDLNLCFRRWIETRSHAAFYALLRNLVLGEAVQAAVHLGDLDAAAQSAGAMQPGPWRAISPWPWFFSLCLVGGDSASLPRIVWAWFDEDPLDARIWERVLKGMQALQAEDLRREFLAKVLPAARRLLTRAQWLTFLSCVDATDTMVSESPPATAETEPA